MPSKIKSNNDYIREHEERLRKKIFEILGSEKCVKCGFSDYRALQIDHIEGKGHIITKYFNGNHTMFRYYRDNPEIARKELQVLCANCNWIKRHEKREFNLKNKSLITTN